MPTLRLIAHPARPLNTAFLAMAVILLLASPPDSRAASRVWDGSVNGSFSTAGNWVDGIAPVAGDDVVFPPGIARLLVTNNFSPNRAFDGVVFTGSNYVIYGNPIIVTNGIISLNPSGTNTFDADVEVRGSQAWRAQGSVAALAFAGDINLNAHTLTVRAATGDFYFRGIVSGIGNIVKTNAGTLRMSGLGSNTYSGFTRVDEGILELAKTGFTAIPSDLIVGDGIGGVGVDIVRLISGEQIANTSDVRVNNSGLLDLNDFPEHIGALTMQGGTIDSGTGMLHLGGDVATVADSTTAFINGRLSLGAASRTFNVVSGPAAIDMRINASITPETVGFASAGITKEGAGSLTFAGTNSHNAFTFVNDGQLVVATDRALGTTTTPSGFPAGTIINGDANLFLNGVQVTNEILTINSDNPGGAFNASGASVWTGQILVNTNAFIASSGTLLLLGQISSTGGFTKIGSGSVTLGGTNANTYAGTTIVRDGTLLLDKTVGVAVPGPLIIGEDELPANTDIVRFLDNAQFPSSIDITINSSGLLDLNGFGQNVSELILNGGDVDAPSPGSILPSDGITVNRSTNSQAIISGRMSVLSNPFIDVTGHNFSPDLRIDAHLFGAGNVIKNGPGEVSVTSSNAYTGTTTINQGSLIVDDSFGLGSFAGGTVVNSGGRVTLRFGVHVGAEALTLSGSGSLNLGSLASLFGSNSWTGNILLSSNASIHVEGGDFLNLRGGISGAFDITKTGDGTLIYSGANPNTYDDTFVNEGTLELAKTTANVAIQGDLRIGDGIGGVNADVVRLSVFSQIGILGRINILGSGLFDLNNIFETTGPINGIGRIDLGSGTLNVSNNNNCCDMFSGLIFGPGNLNKSGDGVWTLTANNTYTGTTTIDDDGTLIVDGSQPQTHVTITDDGRLGGRGIVGNVNCLGAVSPGPYLPADTAILNTSNTFFGAATFFFVDIDGSAPGTGYDQLNVRGTNQLGGASLQLSVGPNFAPVEGDRLTILNNDGSDAIQGTFTGLPNGSVITSGPYQFRVLYSEPFLNDVVLVITNTAAKLTANPIVETGNGNGEIDPDECNLLRIPLMNRLGVVVSGVTATLSSTNPAITVTQPTSTYPNLPANGTRTNTLPFQISTSPTLGCGTNIHLLLTVQTATNGSFTVPVQMITGSAGSPMRFNRTGDQAIPDGGFLNSTINVSGITTPIHHVEISLHLSHTTDDNLDISIEDPDGTSVLLSSDNGGTFDDYGTSCADADRTLFRDTALTPITSGTAPFRGIFQPEQSLSAYRGKFGTDVNGAWTLRIADDTAGGLGTLHCWSIFVYPTVCNPGGGQCERCPGSFAGSINNSDTPQNNRLTRETPGAIDCENPKACPGELGGIGTTRYDAYTFTNVGPAACVTVSLTTPCTTEAAGSDFIHCSAYLGSYDPANKCTNYISDIGGSPNPSGTFSFNVPSNAVFVVVVNDANGLGCTNYLLDVTGYHCPQRLDIARDPSSANRVVLKWSTSGVGHNLVATNAIGNPPLGFAPVGPAPVVVNSKFTVTNTTSGNARFYELRKP